MAEKEFTQQISGRFKIPELYSKLRYRQDLQQGMKIEHYRTILFAFALFIAFTAVYWNHFENGFHFDDSHVIESNRYIKDLSYIKEYFTDGATHSSLPTNQAYRPLLTLSFAIDYWLAGNTLNPFYFHISTFLWVIFQAIFMFFMFKHILMKIAKKATANAVSLFSVGWFVLHTANAETINYISARSDILSTIPVIVGLVIYQYSRGMWRLLALPILAAGILIKPTTVMFVPIVFAYILLFEENSGFHFASRAFWQSCWKVTRTVIPVTIVCLALFQFTRIMEPETWIPGGSSAYHYLITQPFVILRYFWTFFIPVNLSADTDWTVVTSLTDYRFVVGMLFIIALASTIIYTSKKEKLRPISFGLLWFIFALIPTSSIIPLAEVTNDHRMYFPFVGLALSASWAGFLLIQWIKQTGNNSVPIRGMAITLALLILGGNAYGTYQRNIVWSSAEKLWHDVTIKSPNNGRGLMNYGLTKMRKGDYESAINYFNRAFPTDYGNHPYLSLNMAIAQNAMGNTKLAKQYYEESVRKGYNYPDCHYYYAKWLLSQGNRSLAHHHALEALKLSPAHEHAVSLLNWLNTGGHSEIEAAEQRVKETPTAENFLNLSLHYYNAGDYEKCISACELALKIKPDYALAYNNICSAHNQLGNYQKAIDACLKALQFAPAYELAKNNLLHAQQNLVK